MKIQKLISGVLALSMAIAMLGTTTTAQEGIEVYNYEEEVSADTAENLTGLSTTPPTEQETGIFVPFDNNKPNSTWNLNSDGAYYVDGKANGTATLYTMYTFTGVTGMSISLINQRSTTLNVTVYKDNGLGTLLDSKVASFSVEGDSGGSKSISGLSKGSKYYVAFASPCDFFGYIA
ncbi:MAG: hypothetical protein FWG90_14010 [Oscillospiraceae bacterium]|nr:hypothetical protein [Oscillospiraceae bacterium]